MQIFNIVVLAYPHLIMNPLSMLLTNDYIHTLLNRSFTDPRYSFSLCFSSLVYIELYCIIKVVTKLFYLKHGRIRIRKSKKKATCKMSKSERKFTNAMTFIVFSEDKSRYVFIFHFWRLKFVDNIENTHHRTIYICK